MADHAPSAPFPASSRTHGACSWRRGPEPADPREPVRQARQRPRSGGRAQRRPLRSVPDERQEHALPARRGGRDPARGGQARPGDRDSPDRPVRPRAGKVAMGTSETNHSRSQSGTARSRHSPIPQDAGVRPAKPAVRCRRGILGNRVKTARDNAAVGTKSLRCLLQRPTPCAGGENRLRRCKPPPQR